MSMTCMYVDQGSGLGCTKIVYPGQDYCQKHLQPCPFVVRKGATEKASLICGKLPEQGSEFCPKHALIMREMPAEMERRKESSRLKREAKKAEEEFIEHSPLRAQ